MAKPGASRTKSRSKSPVNAGVSNKLLAALPVGDYTRLALRFEMVPLKLKQFIHRPGESLKHVHFPGSGFFSELTVLATGEMVEVATIGREGMAGWSAGMDGAAVPSATMVQAQMETCHRLSVPDFNREMDRHGAFHELVNKYRQALVGVIMQSTACNAVHSLEKRLARWVLMAHDRIEKDEFPLTQEFVAMMLGAARPTVSTIAGVLQKSGVIKYQHGHVTIVDRAGLERASCECYAASVKLLRGVVPQIS
jgi:CRP-like cAMP-binding protein